MHRLLDFSSIWIAIYSQQVPEEVVTSTGEPLAKGRRDGKCPCHTPQTPMLSSWVTYSSRISCGRTRPQALVVSLVTRQTALCLRPCPPGQSPLVRQWWMLSCGRLVGMAILAICPTTCMIRVTADGFREVGEGVEGTTFQSAQVVRSICIYNFSEIYTYTEFPNIR